jgi:M6 family metalloprotease-like protein
MPLGFILPLACACMVSGQAVPQTSASSVDVRAQRPQQLRNLNNEVLSVHALMQQAGPQDADSLHSRAAVVLRARAAMLSTLIRENPSEALSLSFSTDALADLAVTFPELASSLESHGTWQGPIERWAIDNQDKSHRTVTLLKSSNQDLELYFAGPEPAAPTSRNLLKAEGVRIGTTVAVNWAELITGSDGFSPTNTSGTTTENACCATTGVQNVAVFLITFPGVAPPSYLTPQSVYASYFGTTGRSLDAYWREASYGKTTAAGSVFGWYTLSTSYGCSTTNDFDAMRNETLMQAANAGVNLQSYTSFAFVAPDFQCGWAGLASVGPMALNSLSGGWSYINGTVWKTSNDDAVSTLVHESGHNLGLNHSNSRAFGGEALGAPGTAGTISEYGDQYSAMSNGTIGHYAASHKAEILNWLPFELTTTGLQALKIQRGAGNNAWLWVEYRQPIGNYDITYVNNYPQWYPWANQVFSGALIHYEDSLTSAYSHLLDFTPTSSSGFLDPVLAAGQTWTDPYSNVSITVQSATASGLTVSVSYGAVPCTHANPTLSASPLNPSTVPGSGVNYTVSVINNDSAGCSSGTFNLSSSQPSNWLTSFSSTALVLNPGQTGSVAMTKTAPSGTAPGTYAVDSIATSGIFSGSGLANVTVTAPAGLSVRIAIASSNYKVRQTVSITATVLNGSLPAPGASVNFTMTQPGGSQVTKIVTADSTGKAVWSYKIGAKGPVGAYLVAALATYGAQTASGNQASFSVQ